MKFSFAALVLGVSCAVASPLVARQANGCFIIGKTVLPKEVADVAKVLAPKAKCNAAVKPLNGVPDVTVGTESFSKINFATSDKSPLAFALDTFKTDTPLSRTNLKKFQDELDVYTATEAGIRSVGGNVNAIKVPKFFLSMQVSRILTAQGKAPTAAGLQIDHLRDKVLKNAPRESAALLSQVRELAATRT